MLTPQIEGKSKGAILADAKWPLGSIIKIKFLDGDLELKKRVAKVAQTWISRTNADLTFSWLDETRDADIRISFRGKGSWSVLGRHALRNPKQAEPTMNFGDLKSDSKDIEIQEVVLHEFGHALGFIHEHSHPGGAIKWKRDVVIRELSGIWGIDMIEKNIFAKFDPRELIGTPFDKDSIMLYPFPGRWTEDGVGTSNNTDLSIGDIALARHVYS